MEAPSAAAPAADNGKLMDLIAKIDNSDCYARNEASGFPMTNLFIGDSRLGCKSDADEQLIIHVSFQEFVKVSLVSNGVVEGRSNQVLTCRRIDPLFLTLSSSSSFPLFFTQVHSIKFTEFNQGLNPEENPSKIHIFINRENLGFEDCDDVDPEQTLELTAADLRESSSPSALKYVKFQRVKSLTFYIEDNAGADISALGGLKIYGRPTETTNMKDFKKQG
jgi:hypothetical protein